MGVPTHGTNRGRVGTHTMKDIQDWESWFNGLSGISFREKPQGVTGRHHLRRTVMNEPINSELLLAMVRPPGGQHAWGSAESAY